MQRSYRDPITLQGDLGEEVDMFRPHGGRPRNRIDHVSRSDSISGRCCENDAENHSISQYNGRQCNEENTKRYSYLATDPITHSLPETKLVRSQSVRHYKEAWATRDPIGYMHRASISYKADKVRGMKHFPNNKNNNVPVTRRQSMNYHHRQQYRPQLTCTVQKSRSNTLRANADPITHQQKTISSDQSSIGLNDDDTSTIGGDFNELTTTIGNVPVSSENRKLIRALRNPITGEGMCDSDYIDLLKIPSEYYFRRNRDTLSSTINLHPQSLVTKPSTGTTPSTTNTTTTATAAAPAVVKKVPPTQKEPHSVSKPTTTANKPRHQTPPPPVATASASTPQTSKSETKVEKNNRQSVEKKVIRPKKTEVLEETKQFPTEKQSVTENKPVSSAIESQPMIETQQSTKDDKQHTPKAVKPQTLEIQKPQAPKEVAKPQTLNSEEPNTPKETVRQTLETEKLQAPKEVAEPQTLKSEEPNTPKETVRQTLETEKLQAPKEVAEPQTLKSEKLETPKETVGQTPKSENPQTPKEAEKPTIPETEKLETHKTVNPQKPKETLETHISEEIPIIPTSHTLTQSTLEIKSTEKPVPQSLGEELKLATGESEPLHSATHSANDKIPDGTNKQGSNSPDVQSPQITETKSPVYNEIPQQISNDSLSKLSTELPETKQ
ncbi:unnamed protein product [Schistosoma turkestanicum]|nr:unnamed protein product [Schistosoma turkestanicum]